MSTLKTCAACREPKPLDAFSARPDAKDGKRRECRDCRNRRTQTYQLQVKLQAIEIHGGACAQCGSTDNLTLDHIHGGGNAHRREESIRRYRVRIVRTGIPDPRLQVLCVPCHLVKTGREVSIAARKRASPFCPAGHKFDAANTEITKRGSRACRACRRLRDIRRREASAA